MTAPTHGADARMVGCIEEALQDMRSTANHLRGMSAALREAGFDAHALRLTGIADRLKTRAARLLDARRDWEAALSGEVTGVFRTGEHPKVD